MLREGVEAELEMVSWSKRYFEMFFFLLLQKIYLQECKTAIFFDRLVKAGQWLHFNSKMICKKNGSNCRTTYLNFEANIKEKLNRLDYLKKTEVSSGHSIDKSNNQLFVYVFVSILAKRNNQFEQETLHSNEGNNISIWSFNLNKNKMEITFWIFSCRMKF